MKPLESPGVYCNPSNSFDRKGSFYNLGDYDKVALHFVEERIIGVNADEEQGFEAVLDTSHIAKSHDITIAESFSSVDVPDDTLYGKEKLQRLIRDATLNSTKRRDAVFKMLETMGVKTFIVVSGREDNTAEILQRVRDVIDFVAMLSRRSRVENLKCCVLFQDTDGLLYNLVLPKEAGGTFHKWQATMNEFSGIQAMGVLCVLARAFPCIMPGQLDHAQPAFWGLLLALLVPEETSLSWLNASLFVQGIPSTSSYVLINGDGFDWIQKVSIACLVLAGAIQGSLKQVLCITGVSLTCAALLANLGSRAWHFHHWRKVSFCGPLAPLFAFILSVLSGLCFPHMGGCCNIECGRKVVIESVIRNAFWVSFVFLVSDLDEIQKLFFGGTERCDQNVVNIAVGAWIGLTLLLDMLLSTRQRKQSQVQGSQHDLILCEDHCSPVGHRVPTFPDFLIDPNRAKKSNASMLSLEQEMYGALVVAMVILGVIVSMAFTDWRKTLEMSITDILT